MYDLLPGMHDEPSEPQRALRAAKRAHSPLPRPPPEPDPQDERSPPSLLGGVWASDAVAQDWDLTEKANGKWCATSLMSPQALAKRLLPAGLYETLMGFATEGCPADCGPDWSEEVLQAALDLGPHPSALLPENVGLVWEDATYQSDAGFVRIVSQSTLLASLWTRLKLSRVAVVPQENRRGRTILDLSAGVELAAKRMGGSRKKRKRRHPSVNETTTPAEDQGPVKALGSALPSILRFMYETDPEWQINWNKIDLSDGFWRMVVEAGEEYNFAYQLPRRPGDMETYYVIPAALQMGWKNSPALFCLATEATRTLLKRVLALTLEEGITTPHPYDDFITALPAPTVPTAIWVPPADIVLFSRVYVDDFVGGIATPVVRPRAWEQEMWFGRASMHAVHGVFPPPAVLNHHKGRDSISATKARRGDTRFKPQEELLGALVMGHPGSRRTVALPPGKRDRYQGKVKHALSQPRNFMSFTEFRRVLGKLQYSRIMLPCMRGIMDPLNAVLRRAPSSVGLKHGSEVREALELAVPLLDLACERPTHITELVPRFLPDYYGYVDAARIGCGGVWLPSVEWLHPLVWRVPFPDDIMARFDAGHLTNNDLELAGYFIQECMLDSQLNGNTAGVNTFVGTDNSSVESWGQRLASRCASRVPGRTLRYLALRQRWTRRGPQDVMHVDGENNTMADFSSRSYELGFPADADAKFLLEFSRLYPLPPQLGSWRLVTPPAGVISAACSLLRGTQSTEIHPATCTGELGAGLPITLANTLFSLTSKDPPTSWNAATCSWPLLAHCGTASSEVAGRLLDRPSRKRFAGSEGAWTTGDLQTLGDQLRGRPDSTPASHHT